MSVPGLDRLEAAEAAEWARRLVRAGSVCGCKSGAALTLTALVGWPVWVVAAGVPREPLSVGAALAVYVLVVVGSGGVGKIAGIAVGKLRHRWLRRQLARRVARIGVARGI